VTRTAMAMAGALVGRHLAAVSQLLDHPLAHDFVWQPLPDESQSTALHILASWPDDHAVDVLIRLVRRPQSSADLHAERINAQNARGQSALAVAASIAAVRALQAAGAADAGYLYGSLLNGMCALSIALLVRCVFPTAVNVVPGLVLGMTAVADRQRQATHLVDPWTHQRPRTSGTQQSVDWWPRQ